ncbi:MAG: hypothetical protein DRN78_06580 [Thermoproteota archaeon]|nr:MAG: hypothetical protein DRN78_06580 [Candidatus Korarchaeota archaeon]
MKLPRGLSGIQVASNFKKICFKEVRQRGSHLILRRRAGEQVTIPLHEHLKIGLVKELVDLLEGFGYTRKEAISFMKRGKPKKLECPLEGYL